MIPRYNHPELAQVWSDNNRYLLWMRIEFAFLKAYKDIDIPTPSIFHNEWVKKIQERERITKHDVAAFVDWLEEDYLYPVIKEEARFVHYGLTSSDILDTAFSMQIRESNTIIIKQVDEVTDLLGEMCVRYSKTDILGRTHGQAAEVMPFANKLHAYAHALARFAPIKCNVYYGRLCGSVGDQKYFFPEVEENALDILNLFPCSVNDGQIMHRGVFAYHMNDWAILASVIGKIATDVRLLAQTEIGELHEGFSKDQVGSSSMPHKRNAIASENLCGLARVIRGYQVTAMQNIELWCERDISHSSAERLIFPDAVITLGFMLQRLKELFTSLVVDEEKMKGNIVSHGLGVDSQEKMLILIREGSTRREAHTLLRSQQQGDKPCP